MNKYGNYCVNVFSVEIERSATIGIENQKKDMYPMFAHTNTHHSIDQKGG